MLAETIVVLLSLKSRSYDRVPMIITYKHEYGGGGGGGGVVWGLPKDIQEMRDASL